MPTTSNTIIEIFKMDAVDLEISRNQNISILHSYLTMTMKRLISSFVYLLHAITNNSVKTGVVNPNTTKSLNGIRDTAM